MYDRAGIGYLSESGTESVIVERLLTAAPYPLLLVPAFIRPGPHLKSVTDLSSRQPVAHSKYSAAKPGIHVS